MADGTWDIWSLTLDDVTIDGVGISYNTCTSSTLEASTILESRIYSWLIRIGNFKLEVVNMVKSGAQIGLNELEVNSVPEVPAMEKSVT
ncbi:hypothetical protein N7456_003202 [Penicillium angulare]|uniref:Uncharacterized protein n=1 Tax=Penicillium angulare TaxID=116970 RepID=A0A9W9FUD4_9EURO|nr:hypothetical protein N7456_003202 [Penicillium angulare]